jgi:hypothetical protein
LVAGLIAATRRLAVPAPPVTALRFAACGLVPRTRLGVLPGALRRATGLLSRG